MLRTFVTSGVVWLFMVSCSLAQFGPGGGAFGSVPTVKHAGKDSQTRIKNIEAALENEAAVEFVETPLLDAVTFIREKYETPIHIDLRSLEDVGVSIDTPVTLSAKGIRLANILDLMLKPLDLTWTIDRGYVQITTPETAEATLRTEIYDVGNLVAPPTSDGAIVYSTDYGSGDFDQLIELVTRTVQPEMWEELGGVGTISSFSVGNKKLLVISQTYQIQREIRDLLAELESRVTAKAAAAEAPKKVSATKIYPVIQEGDTTAIQLAELVKATVDSDSWKDENKIEAMAGVLVVKNSTAAHAKIKRMLMALDVLKSDPVLNQAFSNPGGFGNGSPAGLGPGFQ